MSAVGGTTTKVAPCPGRRGRRLGAVAGVVGLATLVAACASPSGQPTTPTTAAPEVSHIIPGPSGLLGAGQPQPNGTMWLLSGSPQVKAIDQIDLSGGQTVASVGVSANATAVAQSSTGAIAVGLGTATTGAVELHSGTTGAVTSTVPVGAPVRALAFGADGVTLYVLNGAGRSTSLSTIDTSSGTVTGSVGMPVDGVAVTPDPANANVWSVQQSDNLQQTSLTSRRAVQVLPIDGPGIGVAITPQGQSILVLKGTGTVDNIVEIDTSSGTVTRTLAAAAHSVGLVISPDGATLYDLVGTPSYGNIQVIPLPTGS